jgi:hypothetical protein
MFGYSLILDITNALTQWCSLNNNLNVMSVFVATIRLRFLIILHEMKSGMTLDSIDYFHHKNSVLSYFIMPQCLSFKFLLCLWIYSWLLALQEMNRVRYFLLASHIPADLPSWTNSLPIMLRYSINPLYRSKTIYVETIITNYAPPLKKKVHL